MGTGLEDFSLYPLLCLFEFCTMCITFPKNKIFLNTALAIDCLNAPFFIYLSDN